MKRIALGTVLVLLALGMVPARATHEGYHPIRFIDDSFTRLPVIDTASPEVAWDWDCWIPQPYCSNTHTVTAYEGASFSSPQLVWPSSFETTLPAGRAPVRYRCLNHSTLVGGKCKGMCGVVARLGDLTDPTVRVDRPAVPERRIELPPVATVPVTFTGTASDPVGIWKVELRIYDTLGVAKHYPPAACPDCFQSPEAPNYEFTPSVTWSQTIDLLPGSYVVEAWTWDMPFTHQTISDRVSFLVV